MSGTGKAQNKMVSVYFTEEFLEKFDELCLELSVRRNDFIKAAIYEKIKREKAAKKRLKDKS